MKRRLMAFVLVLVMVLGMSTTVSAATLPQRRAADALYHLDLFRGRSAVGKDFDLDSKLNRAEGVVLLLRLIGEESAANQVDLSENPFVDVTEENLSWGIHGLTYAYRRGLAKGANDGEGNLAFMPKETMKDYEFLTLVLRQLGYADGNTAEDGTDFVWNAPYELAQEVGLITSTAPDGEFTRGDAVQVSWNALKAEIKGTGDTLAKQLMAAGVFTAAEYRDAKEIRTYGYILSDYVAPTPAPAPAPSAPSEGEGDSEPEQQADATADVEVAEDGTVKNAVSMEGETVSATVPAGVTVESGTEKLALTVSELEESNANVAVEETEDVTSYDVHVEGVSGDNTVAILVDMGAILPVGMNMGNVKLYHVENGVPGVMTQVGTLAELDAHNEFYYEPATGNVTVAMATFSEIAVVSDNVAAWEGNFDYSWYTDSVTPLAEEGDADYTIANADQLAAFGAIVGGMDGQTQDSFSGKTVKLICDINIGDTNSENGIVFYPIGYYNSEGTYEKTNTAITSGFKTFEGTFDGNGHTISNFYQNTWEMKGDHNWYDATLQYYRDGMGLFGKVYGGTVKNLTVKNFSSDGEITTTGVIAAYADGATFENIAITNCNPRVYNIGNGGIVGCVGWYAEEADLKTTFTNITVDNSNKISALWGSYDVACGGIVGQYYPTSGQSSAEYPVNAGIDFVNCHVSAQMDVYNDVCANYQYYAYRYTGMLIGSVRENETIDGRVYPKMDGITASGCTVHFGTWNDYYYCELVDNTTASYTHDYQMSRLAEIKAIDGTTITYLDGTTGTVPASGRANYVIVDYAKGHGTDNATCYHFKDGEVWTHDMGGIQTGIDENGDGQDDLKEDKQHIYLEFNNLVTGYGWGVTTKVVGQMDGVVILDAINEGDSVVKFEKADNAKESYTTESTVTIGDLFKAANIGDEKLEILNAAVQVAVSPVGEDSSANGTYEANTTDWTQGTLTFSGVGAATITITDYYFCTPTTINITVDAVDKFASKIDREYDFLYRVGNLDKFPVGVLFETLEDVEIDSANVEVTVTSETEGIIGTHTPNSDDWTKGTLKIDGAGLVTITITDNNCCIPTSVTVEVVAAKNAYTGTVPDANGTNVVLLEDVSDNGFTVSGKTFYGNGFTVTCAGNGGYGNTSSGGKSLYVGYVTVEKGGTLDNVKVICNTFPESYMFTSELTAVDGTYPYSRPAVTVSEDSTISGCYIYGARVNILVRGGNVTVRDTITDSGALANIHIISQSDYTVTLDDVTTIQSLKTADFDSTKNVLGFAVAVGTTDSTSNPTIKLTGDLRQYNWVTQADADSATGSYSPGIINGALAVEKYQHTIDEKTAVNLGIAYVMKDFDINIVDERTNKADIPYELNEVTMKIMGNNVTGKVYSIVNSDMAAARNDADTDNVVDGMVSINEAYEPQYALLSDLGGQKIENTDGCDEYCYLDNGTVKVMFVSGDTKELNLAAMVDITKYTGQALTKKITCTDENGSEVVVTDGKVTLSEGGEYTVTYTVEDEMVYDQTGNVVDRQEYSWTLSLSVSLKDVSVPDAYFDFDSTKQVIYADSTAWIGSGDYVQYMPFLAGLKIYDYNGQDAYLRFDGDNDFAKIAKATINNVNTTGEAEGYHIITVELTDGGKLVIDLDVRATSGGSTHTGSIKVSGNVLYVVNGGTTSAKGQVWTVYDYEFTGNNGVTINSGAKTFGTSGTDATTGTAPSTDFGTTVKYTVTYDANGGNCGQTVGYATSVSAAVTLPTPTRSGYIFAGWYTAVSGGTRVGGAGDSYTPAADTTLYAQWGQPCTVTYNTNGGSCETASAYYDGTALTLPAATRDGYWFSGWYDAAEGGNKIGDAGATYNPIAEITLYAHWQEKIEYTVTYNANGGTCGTASATYQGTALTLPTPTKTDSKFLGWYDAASGGNKIGDAGASYTPSADITLYAQWIQQYTVTYNANSGSVSPSSHTVDAGQSVTLPMPTRSNYTFNGWYTASSGGTKIGDADDSYKPEANITLYAQWKYSGCVTPDTLVTMADGSKKKVQYVSVGEEVVAWNFYTGAYEVVPASLSQIDGEGELNVLHLYFEDGTELKVLGEHGIFDAEMNTFIFIDEDDVEDYLGHSFVKQDGDGYTTVKLMGYEVTTENTSAYTILSAEHYNVILEDMFTVTPAHVGGNFFNPFEICEGLKYDEASVQADIEKYGLYTYEDFDHVLTYEQFVALNLGHFKVSVGKGLVTYDGLIYLIENFINRE